MTPALAAALARVETPARPDAVRVSVPHRTMGRRLGVFRALDGRRPRGEEKR